MPRKTRKAAEPIVARSMAAWFCKDNHLHVEMKGADGQPVATIQLSFEDGVSLVDDLIDDLGLVVVDPDDAGEDDDAIGPTVGSA